MATTTKLTVEEFLALPETKPGSELVDGEVVRKAEPNVAHMMTQQSISVAVGAFLRQHPIGIAGPEGHCVLGPPGGEHALLPDFLVRLVWLIDPQSRTLTVMTSVSEARILSEDDTFDGGDVLPGFRCAVRDILPPTDLPLQA
jgi:Uma2 family endonuclease